MGSVRRPAEQIQQAEAAERRRQVRGLVLLALAALLFLALRTGVRRVFGVGWWRL